VVNIASHKISGTQETSLKRSFSVFGMSLSVLDIFLLGLIACVLCLQLQLQFVQKINWDEFFYLSHIYDAQNGRLDKTLQMGHVYLFRWLTLIPGGEIAQITAGRIMMWIVQLGTLGLIVKTAQRFMSLTAALFSALCFVGLGFIFIHGTSFRADPLAALCMIYAVYVFTATDLTRRDLAALAVTLALGTFVTIKVILFAPLFAVLSLWRLSQAEDKKSLFVKFTITIGCAGLLFLLGLFLHSLTVQSSESIPSTSSLSSTAETVFLSGGLFPRMAIMKVGFFTGLLPSLLMVLGAMTAVWSCAKHKGDRGRHIIILAMTLPLLSFVFYRNAYPYFYAFIFPSAVILAGYAVHKLKASNLIYLVLTVLMTLNTATLYKGRLDETRQVQTKTLAVVHEMFPEPVHYFDRNGMIASFPKAGFFMSSWGIRNYQMDGETRFITEMETKTVPLLINNTPAVSAALENKVTPLLKADADVLRDNYIPHWGHIWVAGKLLKPSAQSEIFSIFIPGVYSIESQGEIQVNSRNYNNGDVIELTRGNHSFLNLSEHDVTLRWGKNLLSPSHVASELPIFSTF